MDAKQLFDDKMQQIKNRSQYYERKISDKLQELKEWGDPKTLWEKVRTGAVTVATDKRTIYVALGITLSFFIVKALVGYRRRASSLAEAIQDDPDYQDIFYGSTEPNPNALRSTRKAGQSLLYELAIMAIQTFLLHYARKLLINFLENRDKKEETITTEEPAKA